VTFSFTAAGGPTTFALRYSAGNGAAAREIVLDGAVSVANEDFPATSTWNNWSKVALSANLTKGRHTLKVWFNTRSGSHQYVNLDNLTVTPTLVIPAASAARNIGIESIWAGAQNAAYVCCWAGPGTYVSFSFNALGGATSLALRYSAGNGPAYRNVELDGSVAVADEMFPATAAWNAWSSVSLNVNLTKGRHTLKIWFDPSSGSDQYLNLDNLSVKTG
jgi:hypothetical protein